MIIALIFLVLMFLAYNYLIFELIDRLLESSRLKKLYRIPAGILNTLFAFTVTMLLEITAFTAYCVIAVVTLAEFMFFYKDKFLRCLFCMLACMIHVFTIRALCVTGFAIVLKTTIYDVVTNSLWLAVSTGITFLFLDIAVFLVIKLIPAKGIKIINQHSEQLWFMIAWMGFFCIYLLINSGVYSSPGTQPQLIVNQIAAPVVILIGSYIVLFFSIKTSSLLGYKEKNEQLEHVVEKEREYRTSVDKDVFRVIEVNFSKNQLISGFEDYEAKLGAVVHNYTEMLAFMIQATVHPEDRSEFTKYSSPLTIVDEFERGKTEIIFDYRRLMPDDIYVWMQVLMVFMKDENTGDVRGFVKIKNIDAEKKRQLELQYKAERDLLTGLYNKSTTEKLLTDYLTLNTPTNGAGVLFLIDIDNFKTINDRLGHLYGDAVLSELSESLQVLFRENDIVGRIGGDEFLVFAKGSISRSMIVKKANDICKSFLRTYENELKEDFCVSGSIGISVFPHDGVTFENLFKNADAALYATKAKGKNGFSFFDKSVDMSYTSTRTEIDNHGLIQKRFKDNRIEYVFKLLYGSEDTKTAIESVLELIAKNFGFSRANIFEFNELSTHFNGVFEWCAAGIESVSANYKDMPLSSFDFIISALEKSDGLFMAAPSDFPAASQEHYTSIGIKSIVHCSIKEWEKLIGVIAFQNCTNDNLTLSPVEIEELRTICQVLSVFMAKQLSAERELRHHKAIETVMDNMNSIAYVVDRETYEVFYENQNVVDVTGRSSIGIKCHCAYRGLDTPCPDCALNLVSEENPRCTQELYTAKFDIYTKTSGSLIDWSNNRKALLISSVDISEYKKIDKLKEQNEKFSRHLNELLSLTKIGAWDWDVKTGAVIYSEAWAEILGYTKDELPQTVETWERMVLPEDLVYANEQIERHFSGEKAIYEAEFRMKCKNGRIIWAQDKGKVSETDADGKPVRFVGVLQDVSRLKNAETRLMENQETLDLAVNVAELGTWDWDIKGNKIVYNDEYLHMLGYSQSDMNGSIEEWEGTNHPEDLPNTIKALNAYIAGETSKYECEIRMKHKDGHYIWTRDVGRIVSRDSAGNPTRIIGGHLNIDALKRSQELLNKLAYYDELTGLANLAKFKVEAKEIVEKYKEKSFVFAKIDIVNFKMVNDIFGTAVGDAVIKKVAELIQYVKKQNKLEIGALARIHDDTFILLDESYGESKNEINQRTQLFEDVFNAQMASQLGNHRIKFRYGRYFPQIGDTDIDNAIECTNLALSRAKTNAGISTFDFDVDVKKQIRREVELTNKMQQALDNNEFIVYMQGKYSLSDESLCGAESLVRWKTDDKKIIPPAEFIPLFEQNGFVIKLDMYMFEQCCVILSDWKKRGLELIPISVNFSRKHLSNSQFAEDLAAIAKRYGIEPHFLEIELTETIVIDSEHNLGEFITSLHEHGFQISIDDFGTGYSSLGMLKNLNIDSIKLDRSFFLDAHENAKAHSLLSNMLNMTIDLGIRTVAEGVEEKAHVDLLRKLNCDAVQGYYFGKPVAADEFTDKKHGKINAEILSKLPGNSKRFNLRKNNELLIDMMDSMPLAFTLWDKNLNIVQCNKEAAALVGFKTEEEMIARMNETIPELQPDGLNSLQTIAQRIQHAFETGYGRYSSWYFNHIDGTPLPCEVTLVRIVNKGEFMVASYVRDMRLQLEAEEKY